MSEREFVLANGRCVNVVDTGSGVPVIFQHGLGGDRNQIAEAFPSDLPVRRITVECRGHGLSPADPDGAYSIAGFADDVMDVAGQLGIDRFILGGISMGAAIALRLACHFPDRVAGLILARPAWLFSPAPVNMQPIAEAARALARGRDEGRRLFEASAIALELAKTAPDNLASLMSFFDRPDPVSTAQLLGTIASDSPGVSIQEARSLRMPVLIIGNHMDHIHPFDHAEKLAEIIPSAVLVETEPKSLDRPRHFAEFGAAVTAFITPFITQQELSS